MGVNQGRPRGERPSHRGRVPAEPLAKLALTAAGLALWVWLLAIPGCGRSAKAETVAPTEARSASLRDLDRSESVDVVEVVGERVRAPWPDSVELLRSWPASEEAEYQLARRVPEMLRALPELLLSGPARADVELQGFEREGRERVLVRYREQFQTDRGALRIACSGRLEFNYEKDLLTSVRHFRERLGASGR